MSGDHDTTRPSALPAVTRSGRAGRSLLGERLAARRVLTQRLLGGFAAMAVAGATLSLTAAPGQAIGTPGSAAEPGFVGYNSSGSASPLKIEIYEPTIPIPAEPQLEFSVGYSQVKADSSGSRSRASYLWPGDPIGEGAKTIIEQLGLPPEIAAPLAENGYPVQVNAQFPSGPEQASDEPLPGMIQRVVAGDGTARAENGSSTDGKTKDDGGGDGGGGGGGVPGLPGLPGLPQLPGLPGGLDGLTDLGAAVLTGEPARRSAPAAAPALPEPLAALVDLGGFTSVSRTDNTDDAFVQTRSVAGDITLLGGLVTIEGVKTVANASSDGTKGKGAGVAEYGDLVIAGQRFKFGSEGYEAAGTPLPIPGFPDQGGALLSQLGIVISVPKPVYEIDGDAVTTTMPGLSIDFDLTVLRKQLGPVTDALNELALQLPDDLGPLKSGVQAAANLSPRMVFTLGTSTASVDTSQAIAPPPPPTEAPTEAPSEGTGGGAGGGGTSSGGSGVGVPSAPTDSGPVTTTPTGDSPTTEAVSPVAGETVPGLPPLLSFPGLLLYGGLLGAGVAGFFTRRLGLLALGGAGSCPHGLSSGLPDLRKVT